jgi:molybdopterin/thiamine biosynthesis adenylyltransferase
VKLGDAAADRHRFLNKRVLLTGEESTLCTENGRESLLSSLRLLPRICPNVCVSLPKDLVALTNECREIADQISPEGEITLIDNKDNLSLFDAILSIGSAPNQELPWTVINSNGWLARVSSGALGLPLDCSRANPIAAVAAACLGVGEVFKRLVALKPERGRLLDGLTFSLYSYRTDEISSGPPLSEMEANLLIVGAGAIGNGIVYVMTRLPLTGLAWIVDPQAFGHENLGTSILIGPAAVGKSKAIYARDFLRRRLRAEGFQEDLEAFEKRLDTEIPYPQVVLCGLDNVDTRHQVQRLWPDLVIDGAISDFGCQVSRHPWTEDVACLICLFRHPPGESAERVASRLTGLSESRVREAQSAVSQLDVLNASENERSWLQARVGRQICSVVQEAVAQQISRDELDPGFQPSAPFVACLSACMVVGELVKHLSGQPPQLQPRFQLDVLRGPAHGLLLPQERRSDCICLTRKHNIEVVRGMRAKLSEVA